MNLNLNQFSSGSNIKESLSNSLKSLQQEESSGAKIEEPRSYKRIFYKKIYSSPLNDYPIENISETENLLLKYGLLEALSVNYDEDKDLYELESGDRRFHALKNLFERYEKDSVDIADENEKSLYMKNIHGLYVDGIYCMVEHGLRDRDSVRARIIIHNETNRPFDPIRTASKINELAQIYTRQNENLPKNEKVNVNKKIAEELKGRYTVRQIIRYKNFDKLIDELKNVVIDLDMPMSEISNYHTMTAEEQSALAQYIRQYYHKGEKLELPTKDLIKEILETTLSDQLEEQDKFQTEIHKQQISVNAPVEALQDIQIHDKLDTNGLEKLKATAAKKIKEAAEKKDKKITTTLATIRKKTKQLEKTVEVYITEAEEGAEKLEIENELKSTIEILSSIINILKGEKDNDK